MADMVAMRRTLRKLWDALTAPLYAAGSPIGERDTRAFTAAILLVVVVGLAVEGLMRLGSAWPSPNISVNYVYLNAMLLALAVTYILGRTRYLRIALGLSIAILSIGVYVIALFGVQPRAPALLAYAVVPILLVDTFFPPRTTAFVTGLLVLMMLLIPLIAPDIPLQEALTGPLAFVLIIGGIHLLERHHSAKIEEVRRREMAEIEHRYHVLAEHSNDGIAILDLEGRYVEMNQRLADMLERPADDLIGRPMRDTIASDSVESLHTTLETLLAGEVAPTSEGVLHVGDEQLRPVELSLTLVPGRDGETAHIQVIVRDISQRQADHEALQRRHRGLMVLNRHHYRGDHDGGRRTNAARAVRRARLRLWPLPRLRGPHQPSE